MALACKALDIITRLGLETHNILDGTLQEDHIPRTWRIHVLCMADNDHLSCMSEHMDNQDETSQCCSGPAGHDYTKMSPGQWKTQALMLQCTSTASCGDISQLCKLFEPMANDSSFLDSCLHSLIADAVTSGHVDILEHLATRKPAGWNLHPKFDQRSVCGPDGPPL